jgi:ABC-type multidrug transport system fused ATPase/permease subunit
MLLAYYDFRPVGWLMARMTSDCERLSNILAWGLLDLIWGSTMMLGIAIAMFYMNISLALIVSSVLPVLAWITGSFNESIMGVRTSKAFVKEAQNLNSFGRLTDEMKAGGRLSAGERQLISFARAILADPLILVMDEATSSVDTVTEQEIQQGLGELLRGRISLIIAHRLSTIRQADRIMVLEHGEVLESGSHESLMSQRGRYNFLYTQQSLDEFSREETRRPKVGAVAP